MNVRKHVVGCVRRCGGSISVHQLNECSKMHLAVAEDTASTSHANSHANCVRTLNYEDAAANSHLI